MKLLRDVNGSYINADLIESIGVRQFDNGNFKVIAYTPSYDGDCCEYALAECASKETALRKLDEAAFLIVDSEDRIIDIF